MSKTYRELILDRIKLDEDIKAAREVEVSNVIKKIKEWIVEFELTPAELGFKIEKAQKQEVESEPAKVDKRKIAPEPKYRNPKNPNETWTGRGSKDKRPLWVRQFIDNGGNIEDCKI